MDSAYVRIGMSVDMRAYVGGVGVAVVCSTHGTSPPPSPSSSLLPPACITQLGAIVSPLYPTFLRLPLPRDPRDRHARTHVTSECAAKMNDVARAAVPRDSSYIWHDQCY